MVEPAHHSCWRQVLQLAPGLYFSYAFSEGRGCKFEAKDAISEEPVPGNLGSHGLQSGRIPQHKWRMAEERLAGADGKGNDGSGSREIPKNPFGDAGK